MRSAFAKQLDLLAFLCLHFRERRVMYTVFERVTIVFLIGTSLPSASCRRGEPVAEIRPGSTTSVSIAATDLELPAVAASDFPWWRGAERTGIAKSEAPIRFSATENVLWTADVPGEGHGSPILWGDQLFLPVADRGKERMSLVCYGRDDGKLRWTCPLHEGGFMHVHSKNTHASPTPACDGERVYWTAMVKDAIWVSAVTLDGKIAWQKEAGPFVSMHGYGSSPVLHEGLVIVAGDSNGAGWLAGLDRQSGDIVWRIQRGNSASFGTPVVAEVAGKTQLLLSGHKKVVSYNPDNGEKLWESEGPATVCANTLAWSGDLVFASGGYPEQAVMAIKGDGSDEVVWQKDWKCYVPSLLVDGERLIVSQDNGVVRCVKAATGDELWSKRLGGDITASPVLSGEHIYIATEAGKVCVLKAGDKADLVAENDVGDRCYATPTIVGGRIYLRTFSRLLCIGQSLSE